MAQKSTTAASIILSLLLTTVCITPIFVLPSPSSTAKAQDRLLTLGPWDSVDPQFGPYGNIIFSSDRSGSYNIWVMDMSGQQQTRLTHMPGNQTDPQFSPNGRQIAFLSSTNGNMSLWIMNSNGAKPEKLTSEVTNSFKWNPLGTLIVYDSFNGKTWQIWIVNMTNLKTTQVTNLGNNMDPSWSANGQYILFSSDRNSTTYKIYQIDVDGGGLLQLTFDPGNDTNPSMSPDGKNIAYVCDWGGQRQLWVMDANGNESREANSSPLQQTPGIMWTPVVSEHSIPVWNPNSQSVIYFGSNPLSSDASNSSLYIFYLHILVIAHHSTSFGQQVIGSSLIQMTTGNFSYSFPSWSQTGNSIAYVSSYGDSLQIWIHSFQITTPNPYG